MLAALEGRRRKNPNIVYSFNERYNSKESDHYRRLLKEKVSKIEGFMLGIKEKSSKTGHETRMSRGASREITMPATVEQSPNRVSTFPATKIGIENNGQVPLAVATAVRHASRNLLRMMQGRGASTSGERRAAKLQKQSLFTPSKKDSDQSLMSWTDDDLTIEDPATLFMTRVGGAITSSSDDSRLRKDKVRVSRSQPPLQHSINNGNQLDRTGIIRDAQRFTRQPSDASVAIHGAESSLQTRQAFTERAQRSSSKGRSLSTLQTEKENTANRIPNSDAPTRSKYFNRFAGNGDLVVPVIQMAVLPTIRRIARKRGAMDTAAPVIQMAAEPKRRTSISIQMKDSMDSMDSLAQIIQVPDSAPVIQIAAEAKRRIPISILREDSSMESMDSLAPIMQVPDLLVNSIRPIAEKRDSMDTTAQVIPEPAEPIRRTSIYKKETAPVIPSSLPVCSIRPIAGKRVSMSSMNTTATVIPEPAEPIRRTSISVHKKITAPFIQISSLPPASESFQGGGDTAAPVTQMSAEPIRIHQHRRMGSMDTCCEPGLDADDYRVGANNSNVESCSAAVNSRPIQSNVHEPIAFSRPTAEDIPLSRENEGGMRRKFNSKIRPLSKDTHNHGQLPVQGPAYRTSRVQQDYTSTRRQSDPVDLMQQKLGFASTRRLSDPVNQLRPIVERINIEERGHSNRELQRSISQLQRKISLKRQSRTGFTTNMPLKLDPSSAWQAVSGILRNASIHEQRENHHRRQIQQSDKTVLVGNATVSNTDEIYNSNQQKQDSIYVDSSIHSIGSMQRRRSRGRNSEVMIDALSDNISTRF